MQTETQSSSPVRESIWIRGLVMIAFLILFSIAQSLLGAMAVIQFLWAAITGAPNVALTDFGRMLSDWLRQVARYQTFATDERPFPWGDWPQG